MIKFSQLESFVAVIKNGSINKAAEQLFISQPTLSRTLKSLENELGIQLLIRQNQGVLPTREGKLLYRYAKSILSELSIIEKIKKMNVDELFAELDVSVSSLFVKDELFVDFKNSCKSKEIVLNIEEVTIGQLINNVVTGVSEVGLAVLSDEEFFSVQKSAEVRKLNLEVLASEALYAHVGKKNVSYGKEKLILNDMMESTCVHLPFDIFSNLRKTMVIDGICVKDFPKTLTVNHYSIVKKMLKETDCFLLGNCWQADELSKLGIETKQIANCDIKTHLLIITNAKMDYLSAEASKFIELVKKNYG